MKVLELAKSRRSARSYNPDQIPLEDVKYILEVARNAPSGANRQPWRFLVIRDQEAKKRIRAACEEVEREFHEQADPELKSWLEAKGITWEKPFLVEAPVLILVFGKEGDPYWVESVWIAIGYMLLAVEELGYSTLTYTPSKTSWANSLLNVPECYRLQAILPVGKPRGVKGSRRRLRLEELCYLDEWGKSFAIDP